MKKWLLAVSGVLVLLSLVACGDDTKSTRNTKTLVAYFSCTGTTKDAAEKVASITNADTFRIEPEKAYSSADIMWYDINSRSTKEQADSTSRPKVKYKMPRMDDYGTIYLGFPIWWEQAPHIVLSFLEQYDMTGKTIVPFFTSGGSQEGTLVEQMRHSAPGASFRKAKNLTRASEKAVKTWLKELKKEMKAEKEKAEEEAKARETKQKSN